MNKIELMPITQTRKQNPRITAAERFLSNCQHYIDGEPDQAAPRAEDFPEAESCQNVAEGVVAVTSLLGILQDFEARLQAEDVAGNANVSEDLKLMPAIYGKWLRLAELLLALAKRFVQTGYEMDDIADLALAADDARVLLANRELADSLAPIEDRMVNRRGGNPDPLRYAS